MPNDEDLPFELEKNSYINSELKYESWFIENPVSRELTKRITIKLGPKSKQEFIVVLKTPCIKKAENLLA
jgi:hypothetical protein